ncbi:MULTISPECIES: helix-turn-helix domain-containing protein [Thalassospira]|uniref:Helix-turn-helix domain-containing protein n=1 Tax=Thalassospira aquimaris TaxID=3037796 RepID=A0ABT6G7P1_9PROT|nr:MULTISPECIES: helix-turn-helix domain-containing protein [Thalassospira]MDG4718063.1 helix-turn-helix domain-containing protein [Thalassospira sp. FZY0004]
MHITRMDQLGPEIRNARRALGLSQTDLSLATGLSIKFISQLETGKADNPSFANVIDIVRALGGQVEINWLDIMASTDPGDDGGRE